MNNIKKSHIIVFVLLLLLCWALYENAALMRDLNDLKVSLAEKSAFTEKLQLQISSIQSQSSNSQYIPSITYCDYEFNKRLVTNLLDVHLYPGPKAPFIQRTIEPYTIVNVLDSGFLETEGRELWLYVSIPVNDSPSDNKGWIRESETIPLTKENIILVRSEIQLKKGTPIYEVDDVNSIQSSVSSEIPNDVFGRIEREDKDFAYIQCGGGWTFWVEKKFIIYPALE